MGWLGRSYVEVTASSGDQQRDAAGMTADDTHRSLGRFPGIQHAPNTLPIDSRQTLSVVGRMPMSPAGSTSPNRPTGATGLDHSRYSDPTADYRTGLISLGVSEAVADRWIRSTSGFVANLGDPVEPSWLEQLQRSVAREIRLSGAIQLNPGERRIVALIGPTGVGKTTTVAKLAAGFRIQSKRRVGLLTIDTFRIAAVQQLQAYAQIMDLPMSVVESTDQMRGAIDQLGDVDLILIDTAGRSPKGDMSIAGLAELLRTAQPDETHLVISATSTAAVVQSALDGFAAARPTAAILSKLDETPYTAGVLSALTSSRDRLGLPISYVTNGQHVPDDIAVATAQRLTERLIPAPVGVRQFEAA